MISSGSNSVEMQEPMAGPANLPQGALVVRERRSGHPSELPSVLSATPNVLGLLSALRRRWRLATFLGLLGAGAAFTIMWFCLTEKFSARTLIHVKANQPFIVGEIAEGRSDFNSYQRTQVAYVKSRLVLNAALRDAKVRDLKLVRDQVDPLVWLEKEIQADFTTAPEILRIHMTGDQPEALTALVNAVREAYLKEVRSMEVDGRQKRLNKLKEIYAEADRKLADKRRMLKQMSEDLGSSKDPKIMERTQEMYWKALDNLQGEMLQTQAKLRQAQMELAVQQKTDAKTDAKSKEVTVPDTLLEEAIQKDPVFQNYTNEIASIDLALEQIKKNAIQPEAEPRYKQLTTARASAKKNQDVLHEKLKVDLGKSIREQVAAKRDSAQALTQNEIVELKKKYQWLDDEFNKRLKSFEGLKKRQIDVEWLRDEITLEDSLAKKMAAQSQLLQVEMQAPERFNVLEDGYSVPDQDSRIKKAGMAGGGTLGFVMFAIAFLEFRRRRVGHVDDVVRGLKIRFVGGLPSLPSRTSSRQRGQRQPQQRWQNQMAESIETTRTMLLHTAEKESLRVIVVTSAVGGEGKTLTCSQLAISLARAGRKTLLVDADLRRPALQKLFHLPGAKGFSELLRGEEDVAAVIQAGPVPGLSIVSAGNSDDRSIQNLSQAVLGEVLKRFRQDYDFVVVDTAPLLPVADSQMICQHADGVIFSVLMDVSRLEQLHSANELLSGMKVRVLGAVVNGMRQRGYHNYSYTRRTP